MSFLQLNLAKYCICVVLCLPFCNNAVGNKHLSIICGNKMPRRCNRGFYCRSYCLLNIFRASPCPSSGAQEYYTVVAACGILCCGFFKQLVWCGAEGYAVKITSNLSINFYTRKFACEETDTSQYTRLPQKVYLVYIIQYKRICQ